MGGSKGARAAQKRVRRGGAHELGACSLEEEPASRDDPQHGGDAVDLAQQVGGDDDRDAVGRQRPQEPANLLDTGGIETVRRLIEDEQRGPARQCHGDTQALLHAQGVLADPLVHLPAQAHGVHRVLDIVVGKIEQALDDPHVLGTGEVPVTGRGLDERADVGQVPASSAPVHRLPADEHPAGARLHQGQQHLHGRGLSDPDMRKMLDSVKPNWK